MEILSPIAVESCPRCRCQPQIEHSCRYQVRCSCGACGPQTRTANEAARRWQAVAHYMRQHQAYVGEMLQVAVSEGSRAKPPMFGFVRDW